MFSKKSKNEEIPVTRRGIKKMDAVVTGVLLGGIVASLYGVKKLQKEAKEKDASGENEENTETKKTGLLHRIFHKK